MPDPAPVEPFGATRKGVTDLLPGATFPEALGVGQKGVTLTMIDGYLVDVSGKAAAQLAGYTRLKEEYRTAIVNDARGLVHNGAASYAQAARFPEKVGKTDDGYAELLWSRFTTGLRDLSALLASWLTDDSKVEAAPETRAGQVALNFPPARITEHTGF